MKQSTLPWVWLFLMGVFIFCAGSTGADIKSTVLYLLAAGVYLVSAILFWCFGDKE